MCLDIRREDMKRALLAAVAASVMVGAGIGVFHERTAGDAYAQSAPAAAVAPPGQALPEASSVDQDAPYREACAREGLNESECVGRLIWFKATAGNDRFHTYTFRNRSHPLKKSRQPDDLYGIVAELADDLTGAARCT
jgi:hypothetical protein